MAGIEVAKCLRNMLCKSKMSDSFFLLELKATLQPPTPPNSSQMNKVCFVPMGSEGLPYFLSNSQVS